LAVPFVVVADPGVKVALPEAMQADVTETVTGVPATIPDRFTWTFV
jgi:hypothetical protein